MTKYRNARIMAAAAAATLLWSAAADAQWALVARRVIGRVDQMSQQQENGGAAYDTAAVLLEVPADKVYAVAVRNLTAQSNLKITDRNDNQRMIQFTNGTQIAGLQVNALSDTLTHLMITSAHTGTQQDASKIILERVLKMCTEMNVECSRAGN
jgi:hypothetical protein